MMFLSRWSRNPMGFWTRLFAASLLFAGGLATGFAAAPMRLPTGASPVSPGTNSAALALQNDFIEVAAAVSPAVVNISSEWTEDVQNNPMNDWIYQFYFGQGRPHTTKQKQHSLGSGFLVTADGYIVTNAHVIGKADKVTVTFENGATYPAKIVGKDEKVDIGVVKITDPKKSFPYVLLGNSDSLKVGQWSIAIGNPFALDHTVTTGVISAKGRSVKLGRGDGPQDYIQTDASINPGNSGGPLCDIEGKVIGINSAIYSQSGGSVGIGFAIPANIARKAVEDLVNEGKVVRAGLGAMVQGLTPKMAKSFGLANTEGALLAGINPGSAAEKAGLKAGDIVLAVDGDHVTSAGDMVAKLYTHRPGDTVQLTVLRGGQETPVPVTLQKLDEAAVKSLPAANDEGNENDPAGQAQDQNIGLAVQDQTADIKAQLPAGAPKGPVVTQLAPQGPAAQAGLQPGDIILKVGNTAIYSANQLSVVLKKSDLKAGVRVYVWRNGSNLFAFLQTGDE